MKTEDKEDQKGGPGGATRHSSGGGNIIDHIGMPGGGMPMSPGMMPGNMDGSEDLGITDDSNAWYYGQ